jgi:lipopolysaccharide transport system permease protein
MSIALPEAYETIIEPRGGGLRIPWRELWAYRDLLALLVRRDFISKYKQTILGPAWFVLQPLLLTAVFALVFGKFAAISTDGLPPMLFYLCNQLAWAYFAANVTAGSAVFTNNSHLFGKVYFPRLIVPASVIISNAFAFALALGLFVVLFFGYRLFTPFHPNIDPVRLILLTPALFLLTAALSMGVGLVLSSLSAKYRDLVHLTPVLLQLWMFATIVMPVSKLPPAWKWIAWANPMLPVVEGFRWALLGQGAATSSMFAASGATTLGVLVLGVYLFQKVERAVVDHI